MQTRPNSKLERRGVSWAPVIFLLAFLVALALIGVFFIEPLLRISNAAPEEDRRRVAAFSYLVLALLIAALLTGLLLTLRIGLAASRAREARKRTNYPDAWEESARRMQTPSADELEDPSDQSDPDANRPR